MNEFEYAYQKGYEEAQAYVQGYMDKTAAIMEEMRPSTAEQANAELVNYTAQYM